MDPSCFALLNKFRYYANLDPSVQRKIRYLIVGGFNTLFGYLFTVGLYYSLEKHVNFVVIMVVANIVCITVSFVTYKLFVFNTKSPWIKEYLRCYLVYGGSAAIGIAGLWLLVHVAGMAFWLAQAMLLVVSVVFSYIGHDRFTFKK